MRIWVQSYNYLGCGRCLDHITRPNLCYFQLNARKLAPQLFGYLDHCCADIPFSGTVASQPNEAACELLASMNRPLGGRQGSITQYWCRCHTHSALIHACLLIAGRNLANRSYGVIPHTVQLERAMRIVKE